MAKRTKSSIEIDYSMLRGRIRQIFGTEQVFADEIGRTHNFVSSVFNGYTFFTPKDIYKICEVLGIESHEIGTFFYTRRVCETKLIGVV